MKKSTKTLIIIAAVLVVLGLIVPYIAYKAGYNVVSEKTTINIQGLTFGQWLKAYYQNSCRIEKPKVYTPIYTD